MLNQFILVSGWAFWVIIAAAFVLDVIFLSTEEEGWAVFIAAAAVLGAVLFTDAAKDAKIVTLVAAFAAYMVLGVLWSIKKWWTFVKDKKQGLRNSYNSAKIAGGLGAYKSFDEYFVNQKQPVAADNKQRIVGWMALWPFSFAWWVLTWPRRAFVWLYERLSTLYDRISAHIWASV